MTKLPNVEFAPLPSNAEMAALLDVQEELLRRVHRACGIAAAEALQGSTLLEELVWEPAA